LVVVAGTIVAGFIGLAIGNAAPVQATIAALGALLETIAIANALVLDIAVVGTSLVRHARTVVAKLVGLAIVDGTPMEASIGTL
jgi:hypothetical protein